MNSQEWFERAKRFIPGGVSSPVRSLKHVGGKPVFFDRAQGAFLYSVEGRRFTDFCMAFGPHILGHCPPVVVKAVQEQAEKAMTFGACHPGEVELAEKILRAYPFLDQVRLVNSGTEAVMTAVRLARGATSRTKIVQFEGCYHGHSDGFLAKGGSGLAFLSEASSQGVPPGIVEETLTARWDRPADLERVFATHGRDIAAVILEPVPANNGMRIPSRAELVAIKDLAERHGALVIFDEVICGFRLGGSGASGYFDLRPDLVTLGKIVGGGLPVAAVVGRREILEHIAPVGGVYQAGTLAGNPLGTAAGLAMLTELAQNPPYEALANATERFCGRLQEGLGAQAKVHHIASMFWIEFAPSSSEFPPEISPAAKEAFGVFFQKALGEGIYLPPSPYEVGFLSTAHTPEILDEAVEKLIQCAR